VLAARQGFRPTDEIQGRRGHGAQFAGGSLAPTLLEGIDVVGWSQGLSPVLGAAAPLHAAAIAAGVPVHGELEFFARELAALRAAGHASKVVAITGTNGKTTTTRLVGHLCRQAGLRVAVAGNISPAALESLRTALEHDDLPQIWVLELASYQLVLADSFVPDCATVLNITQDHLDWHGSFAVYVAAKQRIYAPGTVCVFNRDDPLTRPGASLPQDPPPQAPADDGPDAQAGTKAERLAARRAAARAAKAEAESKAAIEAAQTHGDFSRFETLNGLLVAFGGGLPCLYDVSDPTNLRLLEEAVTRELSPGDLGQADGGAGLGIWQAQGNSGVGVVRLE
jgi:UDP-N-acetylmuramoylalanine-D-glutamate ligase